MLPLLCLLLTAIGGVCKPLLHYITLNSLTQASLTPTADCSLAVRSYAHYWLPAPMRRSAVWDEPLRLARESADQISCLHPDIS